jgi:endonuclease-3 related protein
MRNTLQTETAAAALHTFYSTLCNAYGPQHWWPARTRFEVIIGAYLTQATAWASVERSIANLRRAGCLSLDGLRRTPSSQLQALIRPSGFARRKAASLRAFVSFLDAQHGGSLDRLCRQNPVQTRQQLLALPGVGPETADAILVYALGQPAIVIDTYLRRVAHRHGLIPAAAERFDPELRAAAEEMLSAPAPEPTLARAQEFHAVIVEVGKRHCRAMAQCEGCPLQKYLPKVSA